jgi:hypothetical protein
MQSSDEEASEVGGVRCSDSMTTTFSVGLLSMVVHDSRDGMLKSNAHSDWLLYKN